MKILFLTRLFYPHVGGVEKHLFELSKRLIKRGHRVTIVTTQFDKNLRISELVHGIKVIRFKQPEVKFIGLLNTWLWLLKNRALIKESDIIHVHDVFIWYWPLKIVFPRNKVYVTFHGQWGKYPISKRDVLQKRIGARFSIGVMCIGDYIPKNYGIKADTISYGATTTPSRSGVVKKDRNEIVYVGRLGIDTGLPAILDFLKRSNDINHWNKMTVEFCGDGELRNECEKYGKVQGFTDPKPFYRKAKYVFASGYLTILEAIAYKCLVFTAYSNPLQKEYYETSPFKKHILIANDPKEFFKKFNFYQKNPKAVKSKVEAGYNWVAAQTWDKLVDDYLNLWGNN